MLGLSFVKMALTKKIFCNSITCEYWQLRLQIIALQEDGFQSENKVDEHKDDQQSIKDEVFNISSRKFRHISTDIRPFFTILPNARRLIFSFVFWWKGILAFWDEDTF